MTQSPPRSAAQLGRVRRGPFGFACVSSQLPPARDGAAPKPQPVPTPEHPPSPGRSPGAARRPSLLPPSPSLRTPSADGKLYLHHNVFIRLYGTAASTGSFTRPTAMGPGPGCPPAAPGARSSLPGGPGADGKRAAVQGLQD